MSLLNLGQTDGGSVGGDCINISSPKERSSFGGWTGKSLQNWRRRQWEKDKSLELNDFSHYLFSFLYLLLSFFIPLAFHFFCLSAISCSLTLFPSITKNGCRLMGSSNAVSTASGLTGERAEGERQDSTSPLTLLRIHLNSISHGSSHTQRHTLHARRHKVHVQFKRLFCHACKVYRQVLIVSHDFDSSGGLGGFRFDFPNLKRKVMYAASLASATYFLVTVEKSISWLNGRCICSVFSQVRKKVLSWFLVLIHPLFFSVFSYSISCKVQNLSRGKS